MAGPEARVEVHVYCQQCDALLYGWTHRDVFPGYDVVVSVAEILSIHSCRDEQG